MANEMNIELNKLMGFAINGVAIPDPSSYGYASQSLDVSAERDTTGLLHRKMVSTKFNVSLSWNAMDYATATQVTVSLLRSHVRNYRLRRTTDFTPASITVVIVRQKS